MSRLSEFYDAKKVPAEARIPLEKNVLLVTPDKGYDISPVLSVLELSPFEVAVTYPKEGVEAFEEIEAAEAKVVLQVDCQLCRKYHTVKRDDPSTILPHKQRVHSVLTDSFVGLHHHDEFSIRDGLGTVHDLVKYLKLTRRSFACISNHGSIGGWIKQYNACKKAGIKALFAMEAYYSDYRGDDPELKKAHRSANHLLLIANTAEGFYNIIRLHNDACLHGFYYSPRVNREALQKWGKGIVATSACMAGEIPSLLMEGKVDEAKAAYAFYSSVFDKFYIEIQIIEYEEQREANRRLIQFAKEVGAPLIVGCDSHYIDPDFAETHDILMCIRQKKTILDKREKDDIWQFDVRGLYYRNFDQVKELFEGGFTDEGGNTHAPFLDDVFTQEVFAEAMANTRLVAVGAQNIHLDPTIRLPKVYADGKKELRRRINEGFAARGLMDKDNRDEYLERVKYEFETIVKLGWGDYFLVMEKIVSDAKAKFGEWVCGFGRGSAGGSLVSYCLGITDVDPIHYGLLFERFIDPSRPDPPDIDTDFDPRYRDWIKQHIVEVFGSSNVCSIGTYSTYKTRAVILDVARALGENVMEANAVTKRIEPLRAFEDGEGEERKVDDMSFDEICEHYAELKSYFEAHPAVRRHAEILRNQVKNMGTHAGGVIISDLDLQDRIPVLYDKISSEDRQVISAWAESGSVQELSSVGLVKYDILGLNNLPVISDCIRLIKETTGTEVKRAEIPIDDRESILFGSKKDLVGIFQFENPVTKPIVDAVGMEGLIDVAAITSLIRPGPMDADINGVRMPLEYARRKHGGAYECPEFIKKALVETHGLIVFQEDVMRISRVLAGFTAAESNKLRKAAGKKIKSLMDSLKEKFIKGSQPRIDAGEITLKEVEDIWGQIETFAGYGFNKSHAVAYGAISTTEMWLKYNYPLQFITALLNNTKLGKKKHGSTNLLTDYINYARRQGIEVLPPDINLSGEEFRIEGKAIRFPLGHVKNVATAAKVIESFQPFTSMDDFYDRCKVMPEDEEEKPADESADESSDESQEEPKEEPVKPKKATRKKAARRPNRRVVENLIAAGAFDKFGTRNQMLTAYHKVRKEKELPEDKSDEAWQTIETEVTGICLSKPILYRQYEKMIAKEEWYLVSEIPVNKKRVVVFGEVLSVRQHVSKAGNMMHIVHLSDGMDEMKFFVFGGGWEDFKSSLSQGSVAAIPLSKFDDEDSATRFFDEKGKIVVIKK